LAELKAAHADKNLDRIKTAMENLNTEFSKVSQDMYNAASAGSAGAEGAQGSAQNSADAEVTDVDFEEVKDDKK